MIAATTDEPVSKCQPSFSHVLATVLSLGTYHLIESYVAIEKSDLCSIRSQAMKLTVGVNNILLIDPSVE